MNPLTRRRKLLYTLFALFLFLAGAEIVLALGGWHQAPSERVYTDIYDAVYEMLPHVPLPFGNARVPNDPTNHAGFRGPEFSDVKPPGVYRIIVAGDSTAFGAGVTEPETYARRLETILREKGNPKTEVINAGIPGTNIYAHRLLFARKLVNYQPDLVIFYVLFNSRPEIEAYRAMEHRAAKSNYDPVIVAHRVLREFRLYRWLRKTIKGGEQAEIDSQFDAAWRHLQEKNKTGSAWVLRGFREDLLGIIQTARARNIKLLLVYHLHRDLLQPQIERASNPQLPLSEIEKNSEAYRNFAQALCEHEGIAFLDPTPAFVAASLAGQELFLDAVHFSPAGHQLMAELLADQLGSRLFK